MKAMKNDHTMVTTTKTFFLQQNSQGPDVVRNSKMCINATPEAQELLFIYSLVPMPVVKDHRKWSQEAVSQ